jgi:hypothetical protein
MTIDQNQLRPRIVICNQLVLGLLAWYDKAPDFLTHCEGSDFYILVHQLVPPHGLETLIVHLVH